MERVYIKEFQDKRRRAIFLIGFTLLILVIFLTRVFGEVKRPLAVEPTRYEVGGSFGVPFENTLEGEPRY